LFGRGVNTVFNSSGLRFGWAWKGSANAGRNIIRLGIGAARGTSWWSHVIFWSRWIWRVLRWPSQNVKFG